MIFKFTVDFLGPLMRYFRRYSWSNLILLYVCVAFRLHLEVLGSVRTFWWCWRAVQSLQPLPASELSSERITSAANISFHWNTEHYILICRWKTVGWKWLLGHMWLVEVEKNIIYFLNMPITFLITAWHISSADILK